MRTKLSFDHLAHRLIITHAERLRKKQTDAVSSLQKLTVQSSIAMYSMAGYNINYSSRPPTKGQFTERFGRSNHITHSFQNALAPDKSLLRTALCRGSLGDLPS